jgi:ubiquinone/menaquinone biosynthesis C-methylase UbiE
MRILRTGESMHHHEKFDVTRLERLDDESRFELLDPAVLWAAAACVAPGVIVDVGAGTGLFARRFAALAPSATVFAVDTEPAMIRWMEEHADPDLADRVHPVLAQESLIPLPDALADMVVMIDVHHELADPAASYREALRLLQAGGLLLVADWGHTQEGSGPPQEIRSTAGQIAEILSTAGFIDIVSHEGLPSHSLLTARKSS